MRASLAVTVAAVLCAGTTPPLYSQGPLPSDSAATVRLREFISVANRGDSGLLREYIQHNFSPTSLKRLPLDRFVQWYGELYNRTRGVALVRLETTPNRAAALLRGRLTGGWEAIGLELEPDPPYRIARDFTPDFPELAAVPPPPAEDQERVAQLRALLDDLAAADAFSGVVLLAKGDSVLFAVAHGPENAEQHRPNRIDTRFQFGSITKTFTAVAIAQLAELGRLSYDDPLTKYFSAFPVAGGERVRIEHLLSHTSGLADNVRVCDRISPCPSRPQTIDDYVRQAELAQDDTLQFAPGSTWSYSNSNFDLLGKIVELASGQPYHSYIQEHVFRPAGMTTAEFFLPGQVPDRLAVPYDREFVDGSTHLRARSLVPTEIDLGSPNGGAFGTAIDLLKFARALLGGNLVRPSTVEVLLSPKPELGASSWGFGFEVDPQAGIASHGGTGVGASAALDIFLKSGYTAIVLSNVSYGREPARSRMRSLVPRRATVGQ